MESNKTGRPEKDQDYSVIPKHGGFRKLKSFQVAQLVYDVTVRFCDRYIDKRSRTHDQMVQAARSGVQNIAEGSVASGTSKKTELKLTNVAKASLAELRLDYEDFLRQQGLKFWSKDDPRCASLVVCRCRNADDVALWIKQTCARYDQEEKQGETHLSLPPKRSLYAEYSANAAVVLIGVATALLKRQLDSLADAFGSEGGFTERLYRSRTQRKERS
ncbi:MAG: four helix bundle protein [Candidatus Hydrogenedentes bacterium]|jgi:four helix bundle suffix protein|nr:four helix bundle protein [Candidatus Hydrogenedentota bacterium]